MAGESKFVYELDVAPTPLTGDELIHVNVPDGAGGWNSRQCSLDDIVADVVPASGISQAFADGRYMQQSANLGDLDDLVAARGNLSVYSKAEVDAIAAASGTFSIAPTKPVVANFTLMNGVAGVAAVNTAKGIKITATDGAATVRFLKANASSSANFVMTVRLNRLKPTDGAGFQACIVLRNSTNGRILVWGDYNSTQWLIQQWSSYAAFSGNLLAAIATEPASFPWRRVTRVGGNLTFEASQDGENWGLVIATTVAAYLTLAGGGDLDEVGIGVQGSGTTATNVLGTICQSFTLV